MQFYHYTSGQNFRTIQNGNGYEEKGLRPTVRFLPLLSNRRYGLPEKSTAHVIIGLLDPFDRAWCQKTVCVGQPLLETVIRHICGDDIYLLKATLLPKDDAYVANGATHMDPDYLGGGIDEVVKAVKRHYWHSLMPFAEYKRSSSVYLVPEVVCFSRIPLGRVRVVQVYNRDTLINMIRTRGGFDPYPPRPKPNDAFDKTVGLKKGSPGERIGGRRNKLRLVEPE